ncbi:MAG TPA: Rossmann-like and DUF2520 domain-containing protein [Actinomycetota bacterium]|nr:Rossmann-like and DUF2520 domain-containing protein [Actinomycetota bacterium]
MDVAVVGAGTVGTAVAVLLGRAGHRIVAVAGRAETRERAARYLPGVEFVRALEAAAAATLVVIGTPDDAVEPVAADLAAAGAVGPGTTVVHLSGSLGVDTLRAARDAGAIVLSVHPLQTFPDVDAALERLPGSPVAVTAETDEGYVLGERLAKDLGATPFRLDEELRPLYHAAAVFASNYLVTTSAIAESLFGAAGVPDPAATMAPLQRASLEHVERLGAATALTGPAVRGDAGTIRRNLEALARHAPATVPAYVAMARASLELAERSGRLVPGVRAAVEDVLDAWT